MQAINWGRSCFGLAGGGRYTTGLRRGTRKFCATACTSPHPAKPKDLKSLSGAVPEWLAFCILIYFAAVSFCKGV